MDHYPLDIHDSSKVTIRIEKFLPNVEHQNAFCSDVFFENLPSTTSLPISDGRVYLSVCALDSSKVRISCYFKIAQFGRGIDSLVIKDKLIWADVNRTDIGRRSG
jgi:hypothetical protein